MIFNRSKITSSPIQMGLKAEVNGPSFKRPVLTPKGNTKSFQSFLDNTQETFNTVSSGVDNVASSINNIKPTIKTEVGVSKSTMGWGIAIVLLVLFGKKVLRLIGIKL